MNLSEHRPRYRIERGEMTKTSLRSTNHQQSGAFGLGDERCTRRARDEPAADVNVWMCVPIGLQGVSENAEPA